ncbi:RNAse III [Breoghania corrubedonensis]|uniref:Ribonuclease 3 n=1 Tax=Breoghania corrubedonensis TaxID=665038 RepID=A0A2T5VC50_9HYPH|nr:ribonuclease III [Breoghania corrubedonensis]PTW61324.1 RNAse III [Breoghania corrubedonensis]
MARDNATSLKRLERELGHEFSDRSLIIRALTHASALPSARSATENYERLEFLGDRVLGLAVADMVFQTYPKAEEGELARRLNHLVKRETCAEVAAEMGLGEMMVIGESEAQSGGRSKVALLADMCESVLGALYRDAGWEAARRFIDNHWRGRMLAWSGNQRDAKTTLQEWVQGKGLATPNYKIAERSGPDHAPLFTVTVAVDGMDNGSGTGPSKRLAEQAAAEEVLRREGVWSESGK